MSATASFERFDAVDIERRANDSFGELQGLSFVATGVLQYKDKAPEQKKIRYRLGYRPSINHLTPYSFETLVPNPGEPHLSDSEIADYWVAFDGEKTGRFKRNFITGQSGKRPSQKFSKLSLFPGYAHDYLRSLFVDNVLHLGNTGIDNHQMIGALRLIAPGGSLKRLGDYQGFPLVQFTRTADRDGPRGRISISVTLAISNNPILIALSDTEGTDDIDVWRLRNREVLKLKEREGYLLPTHFRWTSTKPQKAHFELKIDEVERLPRDFQGLWDFDHAKGVRLDFCAKSELDYIPFTSEEQRLIDRHTGQDSESTPFLLTRPFRASYNDPCLPRVAPKYFHLQPIDVDDPHWPRRLVGKFYGIDASISPEDVQELRIVRGFCLHSPGLKYTVLQALTTFKNDHEFVIEISPETQAMGPIHDELLLMIATSKGEFSYKLTVTATLVA